MGHAALKPGDAVTVVYWVGGELNVGVRIIQRTDTDKDSFRVTLTGIAVDIPYAEEGTTWIRGAHYESGTTDRALDALLAANALVFG